VRRSIAIRSAILASLAMYVAGSVLIHAHHGAHVLPDRSAEGVRVGRHLYTVRFTATELWASMPTITASSMPTFGKTIWSPRDGREHDPLPTLPPR